MHIFSVWKPFFQSISCMLECFKNEMKDFMNRSNEIICFNIFVHVKNFWNSCIKHFIENSRGIIHTWNTVESNEATLAHICLKENCTSVLCQRFTFPIYSWCILFIGRFDTEMWLHWNLVFTWKCNIECCFRVLRICSGDAVIHSVRISILISLFYSFRNAKSDGYQSYRNHRFTYSSIAAHGSETKAYKSESHPMINTPSNRFLWFHLIICAERSKRVFWYKKQTLLLRLQR